MTKRFYVAAAVAAITAAAPASAVTVLTENGSLATFAAPYGGLPGTQTFTFNSGSTATETTNLENAGFAVTSTGMFGVRSAALTNEWAVPTPGDSSPFVSVQAQSTLTLKSSNAYNIISLYLGSADTYNFITLFDSAGAEIASFSGSQLAAFAVPAGSADGSSAYRVTFLRDAGDAAFGGLSVQSTTANAAEFDNLVFAVPEPSTWALMLAGFGMVGMSMRARRRRTSVVFG